MWNPDDYLKKLYDESRKMAFHASSQEEWASWRCELKAAFLETLGELPETRPSLEPKQLELREYDGYVMERVEFTTFESLRMPAYVLTPQNLTGRAPAVVACHGHGYGSRELVGLLRDGSENTGDPHIHQNFAIELVKQGYVVIAPELLGFGQRVLKNTEVKERNANACFEIATYLLMLGRTIAGYRIHETSRAIDYLLQRPEVDPSCIGIMGLSGGGLVAAFTAAIDERIQATVISGYTNLFEASILDRKHCLDNYIPGVLQLAEMPDLIGMIAPRPLFVEAGEQDRVFPIAAAKKAYSQLERIYDTAGKPESLSHDFHPGSHEIWGEHAYAWLSKQLL